MNTYIIILLDNMPTKWYSFYKKFQSKHIQGIKTSVLYVNNKPNMITLDYNMDVSEIFPDDRYR